MVETVNTGGNISFVYTNDNKFKRTIQEELDQEEFNKRFDEGLIIQREKNKLKKIKNAALITLLIIFIYIIGIII